MKEQLLKILEEAKQAIGAGGRRGAAGRGARAHFLGKKGELTAVLRGMGKLSAEERPVTPGRKRGARSDRGLIEQKKRRCIAAERRKKLAEEIH